MSTESSPFLDLPPEMRNRIYEQYIDTFHEYTVYLNSIGALWAPPLAQVSKQVRDEFMSYWQAITRDLKQVKHVQAQVVDLDFAPLMAFLDTAGAAVLSLPEDKPDTLFESVDITLIITTGDLEASRLQKWIDWGAEPGTACAPSCGASYTAHVRDEAVEADEDVELPEVDCDYWGIAITGIEKAVAEACEKAHGRTTSGQQDGKGTSSGVETEYDGTGEKRDT